MSLRTSVCSLLPLLVALLWPSSARAQQARLDLGGRVTASRTAGSDFAHVGDPRFVTVSPLLYDTSPAHVEVLDFTTRAISQVTVSRAALNLFTTWSTRFGTTDPGGELVWLGSGKSGLHLRDSDLTPFPRHFYVELDASGNVTRYVMLGTFGWWEASVRFLGTEPGQRFAWFSIERYDPAPVGWISGRGHVHGPKELALLRLDLVTLTTREVAKVTLPARPMVTGYEDRVTVFPSDDFSRFAVVEYDEVNIALPPPAAGVIVVDASTGAAFAVPALKTTYGAAFSRDGKYLYLVSDELGTLARVDLAARRVDKTTPGPKQSHALVISQSGKKLFTLATGSRYQVCDLPDVTSCQYLTHDPGLAPAMDWYFGAGIASLDGRFLVVSDQGTLGPITAIGMGMITANGTGPNGKMVVGQLME